MAEVKCQFCGKEYLPGRATQRFCSKVCSDRWWAAERSRGMAALARERDRPFTYAEIAQNNGAEGEQPGPLPTPNWSHDPCGAEPLIEGNSDRLGVALGGQGR